MGFSPQIGPQSEFLSTKADIAIYGGAAGGGKSFALLLEPLRHYPKSEFTGIIFRRNSTQVRNPGGLWQESLKLYTQIGGKAREAFLEWEFPSGWKLKFAHLENDSTVYNYQGAQIPYIAFDELTHFTAEQFWYLLSRNRSTSGIPGYIRATCNPDVDSWIRPLIDWWIDDRGYPITERSGVLRWFIRVEDILHWGDSAEELKSKFGESVLPKSFTFIPSKVTDNKILMDKDPAYLANLQALSRVERERLLGGNWNIRASSGMMFQRDWFRMVDAIPAGWVRAIRFWDRAVTKPSESNPDPDWTRGLLMYKYPNGTYCVGDLRSLRDTPGRVEDIIRNTASYDSNSIQVVSQQDPGSAGVAEALYFTRMLAGYSVKTVIINKDKINRAKPASAQAEAGNISVFKAPWNNEFFTEIENFPEGRHDDIVDVLSGAFNELTQALSILDVL